MTVGGPVASAARRILSDVSDVPLAIAFGATSIPVASALIAAAFAARLGGGALARPAAHRACWALGFACFAAGAAAEAYGAAYGWSPVTFRIYYLAGGVLAVGFLGLGATWLHARRELALFASGAVLATAVAAAIAVLNADVDATRLAEGGLRPPPNAALTGLAFLFAIVLNTLGTIALLGGIVRSLRRRERPLANLLVGAGVLVVASSGTLTRVGDAYGIVLGAQIVGLIMIYAGFELASQRVPSRRAPAHSPSLGAG
jgi:MFS family permease